MNRPDYSEVLNFLWESDTRQKYQSQLWPGGGGLWSEGSQHLAKTTTASGLAIHCSGTHADGWNRETVFAGRDSSYSENSLLPLNDPDSFCLERQFSLWKFTPAPQWPRHFLLGETVLTLKFAHWADTICLSFCLSLCRETGPTKT